MTTSAISKTDPHLATYWERVRYDGAAQSSMYVVVNQGRLIMATTSLDLARQTFAKVRQGLGIDSLVGERNQPAMEQASDQVASNISEAANQETDQTKNAA